MNKLECKKLLWKRDGGADHSCVIYWGKNPSQGEPRLWAAGGGRPWVAV